MKTPSDQVFQFIQSLDKYEKAYIKNNFSAYHPDTNSEKLFDYLCVCKWYDETDVLKSLSFLSPTSIKHTKQTLFNYLLKKLERYYAETDEEQQVQKLLFQVKILRKKNFYTKAYQLLNLAMVKAKAHNFYLLQLQMQIEHEALLVKLNDLKMYAEIKKQNDKNISVFLNYFAEEYFIKTIQTEFGTLTYKNTYKTNEEKKRKISYFYQWVISKKREKNYALLPDKIKIKVCFIECYCLFLLHDYSPAKKVFLELLQLYKKSKVTSLESKEDLFLYLKVGSAINTICNDKKILLQINAVAHEIYEALPAKKRNMLIVDYYFGIKVNTIAFLIKKMDFLAAKKEAEQLMNRGDLSKVPLSAQKVFLNNLSAIYLCCGEAKKGLGLYNKVINTPQFIHVREDVSYHNNLLGLAIFYDLKLWGNLKSLLGSCIRDRKFKYRSTIYKQLIKFFDLLLKTKGAENIKKMFGNMLQKINLLIKLDKDKESLLFVGGGEISYWLKAKLRE